MAIATYSPLARDPIDGVAAYIAAHNPSAARRFLEAVESTINTLIEFPTIAAIYPHPAHPGLRAKLVNGFRNYIIFYTVTDGGIYVARALHGARDIPLVLDKGI